MYRCGICSDLVAPRIAITPTTRPLTRSLVKMTLRRGSRSTNAPPTRMTNSWAVEKIAKPVPS